jgi:predicted O-linked N-acetylglucosamine transferase (SPINDLY family)
MTPSDAPAEVRRLLRGGRSEEAEAAAVAAYAARPDDATAALALALVRLQQRRRVDAEELLGAALALDPACADAYANRAALRHSTGRRLEAEADAVRALSEAGASGAALRLIARLMIGWGRADEATAAARRAVVEQPEIPDGHAVLAEALGLAHRTAEAERVARAALARFPDAAALWAVLGARLAAEGRFASAVEALRRARDLDPAQSAVCLNLVQALTSHANTLRFDGRLDQAIETLVEAIELGGPASAPASVTGAPARSLLMFCLLSRASTGQDRLYAEALAAGAAHEAGIAPLAPAPPAPAPAARARAPKLRIGFLAPMLVESSVKYFLRPVFDHHDRAAAELLLYDEGGGTRAPEHERLVQGLADWRDVRGLDNPALARRIRRDRVDVLVDLAGHGWYGRRLGVFAHRPAPVQATCIGYPGTIGMAAIGHRLTDRRLHPAGCAERFVEVLSFLPHAFCYAPPDDAPATAPLPASSSNRITFGSFNQLAKIDVVTIDLWARVLAAVPNAHLLIKRANLGDDAVTAELRGSFAARGIASGRVEFLGRRDVHIDHLAAYGQVDIALDTFPYNGTTTTCEALWMGVPVVTLIGDREVARTGLSLLTAAGLGELAAPDAEAYVTIAAGLARDTMALARLRAGLRQRLAASALRDGPGYARHFVAALGALARRGVDTPGGFC